MIHLPRCPPSEQGGLLVLGGRQRADGNRNPPLPREDVLASRRRRVRQDHPKAHAPFTRPLSPFEATRPPHRTPFISEVGGAARDAQPWSITGEKIVAPFAHVAAEIVETELVDREAAHGRRVGE